MQHSNLIAFPAGYCSASQSTWFHLIEHFHYVSNYSNRCTVYCLKFSLNLFFNFILVDIFISTCNLGELLDIFSYGCIALASFYFLVFIFTYVNGFISVWSSSPLLFCQNCVDWFPPWYEHIVSRLAKCQIFLYFLRVLGDPSDSDYKWKHSWYLEVLSLHWQHLNLTNFKTMRGDKSGTESRLYVKCKTVAES